MSAATTEGRSSQTEKKKKNIPNVAEGAIRDISQKKKKREKKPEVAGGYLAGGLTGRGKRLKE